MVDSINKMLICAMVTLQCKVNNFLYKENGDVNIVSIVVLIGIAVLLAVVFKNQIKNLLSNMFNKINENANKAVS